MATTNYNSISIDLATFVTGDQPRKLFQTDGKEVVGFSVLECPTGAVIYVRIGGADRDRILLVVNRSARMCPGERDGLFIDNPVAGVGTVILLVAYADSVRGDSTLEVKNA